MKTDKVFVLGLMSGTSLDGLDLALCEFDSKDPTYYEIIHAKTVSYPSKIINDLKNCLQLSGYQLTLLDHQLGQFYGEQVNSFLNENQFKKDDVLCIGSHGHTVFHQPDIALTLQIGHAATIAAITGVTTVADFRSLDVALGGQGAPLVPVGDQILFENYDACMNLGGIANISYTSNGVVAAYDICPFNLVFNFLMKKLDKLYDNNGEHTAKGQTIDYLFRHFENLDYYKEKGPKSLGIEWVKKYFLDELHEASKKVAIENLLHTSCEHFVSQISKVIQKNGIKSILITGGGAFHQTFIKMLSVNNPDLNIDVPSNTLVEYKEALIFALMAKLRIENKTNILNSVTGSSRCTSSGAVYNF